MKYSFNKFICSTFFATFLLSCEESLPPRDDGAKVFETRVTSQYFLAEFDNSLKIYINVKNVFDETLEDRALFTGTLEIILVRNPEVKKTVTFSFENIITAPSYNRSTGVLTLDPGRSFVMGYSWDFKADSSISLPDSVFNYYTDGTCFGRKIAFQEEVLIKGEIVIFKRAPLIVLPPTKFTFCYVDHWVRPGSCPPVECRSKN